MPVAEAAVDGEVEGDAAPEGAPPPGVQGGPHGRFGGEEADDDEQHVVGRLLMKSRLAGCGFGSSRLRLLTASPSISTGGDADVHVC